MKKLYHIKSKFPIFRKQPKLVYLDNAATSQKPKTVIERVNKFYTQENSNIHRGVYDLSDKATKAYEAVRSKVAKFIGARLAKEIIFTSGATESINLVARAWGDKHLKFKDEIVISEMEHHSNIVPWQSLLKRKGGFLDSRLKYIPIDTKGNLDLNQLGNLVNKNTKLLAVAYISNVLGTINPIREIVRIVRKKSPKCLILLDAAQAVPHMPICVKSTGCDFVVFSGHKMLGPTGTGVLWARRSLLDKMGLGNTGGGMISKVRRFSTVAAAVPQKYEAGTPNIAGVIGLGAAVDFLNKVGMVSICQIEEELTDYALDQLQKISKLEIYGPQEFSVCGCNRKKYSSCQKKVRHCKNRLGILSFNLKGVHAHDLAEVLAKENIAVRAGHHCAQPLHQALGITASVRASFYLYNTKKDVDALVSGIRKAKKVFK